jgi:hypothetical protein
VNHKGAEGAYAAHFRYNPAAQAKGSLKWQENQVMDTPDPFKGEVKCPPALPKLLARLRRLHEKRAAQHKAHRKSKRRRKTLRSAERDKVLAVTKKRCHICGGKIAGRWEADHVLAFSSRGKDSPENYLPAHRLCNNYRWDYSSEEFQWILKMGVWARTLMKNSSPEGGYGRERGEGGFAREMAQKFFNYERGVKARQEKSKAKKLAKTKS